MRWITKKRDYLWLEHVFKQNREIRKCNRFLDPVSTENLSQGTENWFLEFSDIMTVSPHPRCFLWFCHLGNVIRVKIGVVPSSKLKFGSFMWYSPIFWCSRSLPRESSKIENWWIFIGVKKNKKNSTLKAITWNILNHLELFPVTFAMFPTS